MHRFKKEQWDRRFIELAYHIASWSNYPGRKVGAVVVDARNNIKSTGYNGLPRGVEDNNLQRFNPEVKYKWAEHAERNAIFNAGVSLVGCRMYVSWFPCMDCARAIVQTGIGELIAIEPDLEDKDWGNDFKLVIELLEEAGVIVRYYKSI